MNDKNIQNLTFIKEFEH